jgi:putative transposase
MTNHVHLLLTPRRADGCALLMKHLGQRYVQHVNRTHRRSGTPWKGRFRSCLAQSERYVLACYRTIALNPRRTGMASHPRQYRWRSYRINAEGKASHLIEPHDQFVRLGSSAEARRQAYRALFRDAFDEAVVSEIRAATNGGSRCGALPAGDRCRARRPCDPGPSRTAAAQGHRTRRRRAEPSARPALARWRPSTQKPLTSSRRHLFPNPANHGANVRKTCSVPYCGLATERVV